jgi:hypothetical protein
MMIVLLGGITTAVQKTGNTLNLISSADPLVLLIKMAFETASLESVLIL